jgi:hypothetical protein
LERRPHRQGITQTTLALKKKVVKSGTRSSEEEFKFGMGMPELMIVLVITLVFFGAKMLL